MKLITSLLHNWHQKQHNSWQMQLITSWNDIVGPLAQYATLVACNKNGEVIIGVASAEWMHELRFLHDEIIKNINNTFSSPIVTNIKFVRHYKTKKNLLPNKKNQTHVSLPTITLNSEQKKALESITDPEFKAALTGFLARCRKFS